MPNRARASDGQQTEDRPGEARLAPTLAILVAIALYALLPESLLVTPRVVVPVLEALLLIPLLVANPTRFTRESRILRAASITLVALILLANGSALVALLVQLVGGEASEGKALLVAALQVWATNVFAYALMYWELDRGGPVRRGRSKRADLPDADFRFPQDEDHDAIGEVARRSAAKSGWVPAFIDYLYTSTTNSSAFSPTDTMPLSPRAKGLMGLESVSALLISVLVIARAVSALK